MLYQFEQRKSTFTASEISSLIPKPHIHPHLELIYLTQGSAVAHADTGSFLLEAGGLFLSFPNQIHFYHVCSPLQGYMMIFSPDLLSDFKKAFEKQVPVDSVLPEDRLPADTAGRIQKIVAAYQSEQPLKQVIMKGHLMALLAEILPEFPMTEATATQDTVKVLLNYCIENYTEALSLDKVSQELHLSKYYICHVFKERMGIGFADFINNLRIEHACSLLGQGSAITDVAYASGFSSIRTFNRVFAKSMGMSPRAYLAEKPLPTQE